MNRGRTVEEVAATIEPVARGELRGVKGAILILRDWEVAAVRAEIELRHRGGLVETPRRPRPPGPVALVGLKDGALVPCVNVDRNLPGAVAPHRGPLDVLPWAT